MTLAAPARFAVVAAVVVALVLDLALIPLTAGGPGWSLGAGALKLRVYNPGRPLFVAAALAALLVAASWSGRRRRGLALLAVVCLTSIAAVLLVRQAPVVFPLGDIAVLEIFTRRAIDKTLLVGPYSQFGWHHPGPLYFYLLAPFYWLSGERSAGLNAGAVVIGVSSVAIIAWSARRAAGSLVSAVLVGSATAYVWRVKDLVASAWNPLVIVLPTAALVVVCAAAACGDAAALPIAVLLASFVVQTDVALVPVVAGVLSLSVAGAVAGARTMGGDRVRIPAWSVNVSAWLLAALWFLPAAEQVSHAPGNITALWRFFVSNPQPGQPMSTALAAWGRMMAGAIDPDFSLGAGGRLADGPVWPLVVTICHLLLVIGAAAWAAARGDRYLAWLASLCGSASLIALWSATRVQGTLMGYQILWMSVLGVLNAGVVAAAAAAAARQKWRIRRPAVAAPVIHGALLATCMWLGWAQLMPTLRGRLPVTLATPVAHRLGAEMAAYLNDRRVHKPLVRLNQSTWGMAVGALLELDRSGVGFAVEDSWMPMFPQTFAATGHEDAELTIADAATHQQLTGRPGNVVVADFETIFVDAVPMMPSAR